MSYSVATPAKSKKAKKEMIAFMSAHFRPAHMLLPLTEKVDRSTTGVLSHEQLAYDEGITKLGFNYSGPDNKEYLFSLCRWMALKIGRKTAFKDYGIDTKVPYYVYDGTESVPVLPKEEWEGLIYASNLLFTDPLGVPYEGEVARNLTSSNPETAKMLETETENLEIIRTEIQRLDELWSK